MRTTMTEIMLLKALLFGKEGITARSYVAGKISIILSAGSVPLDVRNERIYRKLVDEDQT